jgi:D-glycero-D-manno-heptose 1,7-bisphosphate phosphatase
VVISNQAGVGRGLIDEDDLQRIDQAVRGAVAAHGGEIAASYYCLHRKDEGCDCRKPQPGLLLLASREWDADPKASYFIGDSKTDVQAGRNAGCTTVLVLTGLASREDVDSWDCRPEHISDDLPAAVEWILGRHPSSDAPKPP